MSEDELWVRPPNHTAARATDAPSVVEIDKASAYPGGGWDPSNPAGIGPMSSLKLQERVTRVRQVQGRLLCRRSPVVALEAATLAGSGAFVAGVVGGWFVLRKIPTLVTSTDQLVVLTLVGGVFALTVTAAVAGYATARWRHARTIVSQGRVGASGIGLLFALIAATGVLSSVAPWGFPSTNVLAVSALRAGEYLAQHQVAGGSVLFGNENIPVAYLRTTGGDWVEATIPQSAVAVVDQEISLSSGTTYTRSDIAEAIGGGQQRAVRARATWLWLVVGAMAAWTALPVSAQRRRWRGAPWLAPIAEDTLRAIAQAHAELG